MALLFLGPVNAMGFQELGFLLMFILPLCSTQNTYYIRPTPDIPCPTSEVCCIFSDCVDHVDQFFASNTTLVFLSGNYVLETSVRITGVCNLTLTGDSSSLPQVASRITCNGNPIAYFAFKDVRELYIRAIAFDSCVGITTDDAAVRAVSLESAYDSQISNCVFLNSHSIATIVSPMSGGALIVTYSNDIVVSDCVFENNSVSTHGGVFVSQSDVIFTGNVFVNNNAVQGGGLFLNSSDAVLTGNNFIHNHASVVGGGLALIWSNVTFLGETNLMNNTAAGEGFGGGLFVQFSQVEFNGDANFEGNSAGILGGAILINNDSSVKFNGSVRLESSSANYGAAIAAIQSNLSIDHMCFQNNVAIYGAGIYLRESTMTIIGNTELCNNTGDFGGAIYASSSDIFFEGRSSFTKNSAINGGGLLLTGGSKMYLFPSTALHFINNHASKTGGAIEIEDTNTLVYCIDPTATWLVTGAPTECFFQFQNQTIQSFSDVTAVLSFENNVAVMGGSDLYGGTVENCRLPNVLCIDELTCSSAEVFDLATGTDAQTLSISSDPLQVCMCSNNIPDCSNSLISEQVYPGQALEISAIALGQRNGSTAAVIRTELLQKNIKFRDLEYTQRTNSTCTSLHYTVLTTAQNIAEEVTLFAEGPCHNGGTSLVFNVEILPCPPGFQQSDQICVCDKRLNGFTDICNIDNGTILRPRGAKFWVGYDSDSQELIVSGQCPFAYCTSDQRFVAVNDSDTQCNANYNRSGVLCGGCGGTTSLVLGSSRCMQCSNSYLALIIVFALAGIALVFFLFILRLTVVHGTISGLIFYANLVQINSFIFYPSGTTNILTVFIAWINLDFGIETCFYNGMDAYAKIWLQFVFPVYVWILVGLIIVLSHFSQKTTKLLGSNPIAVLATLFLLSYAKVLRTIISALSVSYLRYPGNVNVAVWSFDGNIKYLSGKHIPLFVIAMLALLIFFLPYTLFLFLAQWIQTLQGKLEWRIFSWLNKPTTRAFLDAYHAPYANQHRYWTGLLLLLRCIMVFIFANVEEDYANLLIISSVVTGLITFVLITGGIYKNWYNGILEASFFFNLIMLTVATYHVKLSNGSQAAVTFTLLSIVFITFAGIVLFHAFLQLRNTNLWKKLKPDSFQNMQPTDQIFPQENEETVCNSESITVPISYVELREPLLDEI